METIRRTGTNPLTSAQVILFVVRMWLEHHLLGRQILYRGQLGGRPVFLERFCLRKKKRQQTLVQHSNPLETNQERGQSVTTAAPSNKSKALHFMKTLPGHSHLVNLEHKSFGLACRPCQLRLLNPAFGEGSEQKQPDNVTTLDVNVVLTRASDRLYYIMTKRLMDTYLWVQSSLACSTRTHPPWAVSVK